MSPGGFLPFVQALRSMSVLTTRVELALCWWPFYSWYWHLFLLSLLIFCLAGGFTMLLIFRKNQLWVWLPLFFLWLHFGFNTLSFSSCLTGCPWHRPSFSNVSFWCCGTFWQRLAAWHMSFHFRSTWSISGFRRHFLWLVGHLGVCCLVSQVVGVPQLPF